MDTNEHEWGRLKALVSGLTQRRKEAEILGLKALCAFAPLREKRIGVGFVIVWRYTASFFKYTAYSVFPSFSAQANNSSRVIHFFAYAISSKQAILRPWRCWMTFT